MACVVSLEISFVTIHELVVVTSIIGAAGIATVAAGIVIIVAAGIVVTVAAGIVIVAAGIAAVVAAAAAAVVRRPSTRTSAATDPSRGTERNTPTAVGARVVVVRHCGRSRRELLCVCVCACVEGDEHCCYLQYRTGIYTYPPVGRRRWPAQL